MLGPPDGRYVIRGHAGTPTHVLVLATLGAPQRRLVARRRARDAGPQPPPAPVPTTRATLIGAERLPGAEAARAWLDEADLQAEAAAAVAVLNRVLHLHRTAAADPYAREVLAAHALVVRVGYGAGEQVADGRWERALEPAPARERTRRSAALRPHERLAALLGGRDAALACEELALRARADVDAERGREAALQLRAALEAALAELEAWTDRADLRERLDELRGLRAGVEGAAEAALRGGLDDEQSAAVAHAQGRLEAALRARTAAGFA